MPSVLNYILLKRKISKPICVLIKFWVGIVSIPFLTLSLFFFVGRAISLSKEQVNLIIKDSNLLGRLEKKGIKERLIDMVSGENADVSMRPSPSPLPSKSMVQKQSMNLAYQNKDAQIVDNQQQVKDQKSMTPKNVDNVDNKPSKPSGKKAKDNILSSNNIKRFDEMRKRHTQLLNDVRAEEKKSLNKYNKYIAVLGNDDMDAMGATCKGGATACKPSDKWVESDDGNFSVQSACAFLECKYKLNNVLKDDFPDCSVVVNQILIRIEKCIDDHMSDDVLLNQSNPYVKRLRDLKSAVLHEIGVCSMDGFAENMSREEFKLFQESVENKVLRETFNDTSLSVVINSLVDPMVTSLKDRSAPYCEWLLPEEIELLNRIGGFDNLNSVQPYISKEDHEIFKKIEDAKTKRQKIKDESKKREEYYDLNDLNPIDPTLLKQGDEILKRIEKDEETLQCINDKIINHADQNEVTRYKNVFSCFLNNKNNFNGVWPKVAFVLKGYAKRRIKKNMVTLSDQSPVSDAVINFSANKYQLKESDDMNAPYLFNPQTGQFVMWNRKCKCFLEGCTKGEAEQSYSDNKPLLCPYDELCFFSKVDDDIKVKAKDLNGKPKKNNPPVVISPMDEMLKVNYSAPYTEVMMKDIERKISQLEKACERNKRCQEELNDAISRMHSNRLNVDNPNITNLSDNNRPTKLVDQFETIISEISNELDSDGMVEMMENKEDAGYPVNDVIINEIAKICYDVVDDYVQEVKKDFNKVTNDIYGRGLTGDALKEFKRNVYKLRFDNWDYKWDLNDLNNLKKVLLNKVMTYMSHMDKKENRGLLGENSALETAIRKISDELINYIKIKDISIEGKVPSNIALLKVYIEELCELFYKVKNQDPSMEFLWLPQGTVLTNKMIEMLRWTAFEFYTVRTAKSPGEIKLPLKEGQIVEMTTYPCIRFGGVNGHIMGGGRILTKERINFVPSKT